MKHMVDTSEKVLPEGNRGTSSQVLVHQNVVQVWLIGFATKDESA
jgi:hypothetical protein